MFEKLEKEGKRAWDYNEFGVFGHGEKSQKYANGVDLIVIST